ncbi:MAG: PilZ domain-containing protein [Candidatus Omnitrophica bacterium]|nr:PilZ domain-containing protein [Candidatus Omnitrophota bacterium]
MAYSGTDRRRHPRVTARFIVSYRVLEEVDNLDITQTKNISLGGMLLTTNRLFSPGTNLALEIRLPFDPNPIMIVAKVIASHEITKGLIYDTRLSFLAIDERHRKVVCDTVSYYLRKPCK